MKSNPGARDLKPMATFLTTEEMLKEFSYLDEQLREELVIDNTHKINDMIELVVPLKDKLYTPNIEGAADEVRNLSYDMAHKIYGEQLPEIVEKRLEKELVTREKVLTEIKVYIDKFGISPTVRELVNLVGVKSTSTIQRHLDGLVETGKIVRENNKSRTIRIEKI